jgi:hypothetical protein
MSPMASNSDRATARRRLECLAAFDEMITPGDLRAVTTWVAQCAPAIELTEPEMLRNELLLRRICAIPGLAEQDYHTASQAILRRLSQAQRDELRIILEAWEDTNNGSEVTTRY